MIELRICIISKGSLQFHSQRGINNSTKNTKAMGYVPGYSVIIHSLQEPLRVKWFQVSRNADQI